MTDSILAFAKDPQTILWLLGLAIAFYWYRRSIRAPAVRFQARTISLLDANTRSMFSELEMKFSGRPVQSLKHTWIVIWNRGTAAVRSEEFAVHDPLRIVCKDGEILRCVVKKVSNAANNFTLPEYLPGSENLTPTFEYFDPNDGVQLEIWHTGNTSRIVADGSIVGAGKVSETLMVEETPAYRKIPKPGTVHWGHVAGVLVFVGFLLWATVGGALKQLFDGIEYGSSTYQLIDSVFTIIGYLFVGTIVIAIGLVVAALITMSTLRVPKGLEIDFEETPH